MNKTVLYLVGGGVLCVVLAVVIKPLRDGTVRSAFSEEVGTPQRAGKTQRADRNAEKNGGVAQRNRSASEPLQSVFRELCGRDGASQEGTERAIEEVMRRLETGELVKADLYSAVTAVSDDFPEMAFLLMGELDLGEGSRASQRAILEKYGMKDLGAAMDLLCKHGPIGDSFKTMVERMTSIFARERPDELLSWLVQNQQTEEGEVVRMALIRQLQLGLGEKHPDAERFFIDNPGMPVEFRTAAINGRISELSGTGGQAWLSFVTREAAIQNDPRLVANAVSAWPAEMGRELEQFVAGIRGQEAKDEGLRCLMEWQCRNGDVDGAITNVVKIQDPEKRRSSVMSATIELFLADRNALLPGFIQALPTGDDRSNAVESVFPRLALNTETREIALQIVEFEPDPERRQRLLLLIND